MLLHIHLPASFGYDLIFVGMVTFAIANESIIQSNITIIAKYEIPRPILSFQEEIDSLINSISD